MEYQVVWGGDPEDLLVTTSGDASVEDLAAWVREVTADRRFRESLKVLVDHRATRWWTLSNEEIALRASVIAADSERVGVQRVAFVVGSTIDYGLMRMLQGQVTGRVQFESEIFESMTEGRDWLRATEQVG